MIGLLFALKKIIALMVLPPGSLVLVGITGLLLLKRCPRSARALLWSVLVSLLLLSLPVVERSLMRGLNTPSLAMQNTAAAQAIVILGGGIYRATPEYGDTLSSASLQRVRYGAVLARRFHLPILVSGGSVYGGTAEGEVMAEVLRQELSTEVRWVEARSLDTADNAAYSAALLRSDHIDTVLLVTQDFHMHRALRECERQALNCIGAPITSTSQSSDSWIQELPSADAFSGSVVALRELLGLLAQRLR
jgi:uncharacterized SAM-binding protein YcdF (DUF218 family)